MSRTIITWNDEVLRGIASGPAYEASLRPIAEQIVETAKALAPVAEGSYRDSIHVTTGTEFVKGVRSRNGKRGRRQAMNERGLTGDSIFIVATDMKAHWIEYGTVERPAVAPLRRAAEQVAGDAFSPIGPGGES
jgi:hypothetical protein